MVNLNRLLRPLFWTITAIAAAAAVVAILGVHLMGSLAAAGPNYDRYAAYRDNFGPVRYATIDYPCTAEDRQAVAPVLTAARQVFSYVGPAAGGDRSVGALSRYYRYTDDEAFASADCDLRLVTARISGDRGYLWVVYSNRRYNREGSVVSGSQDILCYWEIRKINGLWMVVDIDEPA